MRLIDWIWHVRGSLGLPPGKSAEQVFGDLDPLFHEPGTSYELADNALVFRKKGQAAQDRMSVFDAGVLKYEQAPTGPVLRYNLFSRSLLLCFFAPLLFLGFAQLTILVGKLDKHSTEATSKDGKKPEKKLADLPQNPIDKFLGAPAPEKPKKDEKGKGADQDRKKPSPTAAYVFAGIFAALYVVGRILEDRLVRSLFRKRLIEA